MVLIPENRRRLPKAAATPNRSGLIANCGNYTIEDTSDSLPENGYPISLLENEILTLS